MPDIDMQAPVSEGSLRAGKLKHVLVQAMEPGGSLYAGVIVEEMKIY
ncbi:hypothetical protein [Streptomyces sp. NPDC001410]